MPDTEIRPAQPEDRETVLAFCKDTWEGGDYIEYVWDEWLHDPRGVLYVAATHGQPIGIAHLQMLNTSEAWLEGMRVDPAHRRHGIATALHNAMIVEAMRHGATVARLMTESANTASISLIERSFWRRIGAFAPFKTPPVIMPIQQQYGLDKPQLATVSDVNDIIDYLNTSNIFPVSGGLYYHAFKAYSITAALIEAKISARRIYILRRWDRLDGLAIAEPREARRERQLSIGYIDGTTEAISLIAYALRSTSGETSVNAYVPDLIMVRDAFVGAEYEWDGKVFYTYERNLT